MTWKQECASIIFEATRNIPHDMPMPERIAIVDAARPCWYYGASWPKKAWQAARRDYLCRFGYSPKTKAAKDRSNAAIDDLPLFMD